MIKKLTPAESLAEDNRVIIENLNSIISDKNMALEHALNRLETIEMFSGRPDFKDVKWESSATRIRIKQALKRI